ncbi:MAG TPA: hypothetical protein QGF58_14995 [Myxococcota bacterium]|nr:hypothetical protein [Myxococcota bacterium]
MSTTSEPRRKRPVLAAILQLTCLFGGLGYAYLGRWRSFGIAFGIVLALQLVNLVATSMEMKQVAMVVSPVIFVFQVLSALDAWQLARGEDRVAMLRWL